MASNSVPAASDPLATSGRSRIPNFFRMSIDDRIRALHERGLLSTEDLRLLQSGDHRLNVQTADRMIENVVGVMGLPLGIGLNFLVNGNDYIVPLCVEEPSIVAGLSGAARTARLSGGFKASFTAPVLIGQVQVVGMRDAAAAAHTLRASREAILNLANSLHPKMVARGGGALDIEVFVHHAPVSDQPMVVLHLLVDTRDAMGANMVNSVCEGVAGLVETLTGGTVFLRILSNLTDRALVTAELRVPVKNLEGKGYAGEKVRDGIILANDLALVDPYRATTHNKGIMNGVDALALATGNDWRALEAAAHAFAARDGRYRSLTRWYCNEHGDLVGELTMPMKVGTVGGSLETNPTVRINHRLLGSPDAIELACIMGAVGLAQNFAALRALSTDGIQQGHMTLHARSVATSAGVPEALFDTVVEALIESGDIKVWKAMELVRTLAAEGTTDTVRDAEPRSAAFGKVILLGEHAVVYGRHAIAAPIPAAVEARVSDARDGIHLLIPRWRIEQRIRPPDRSPQDGPAHGVAGIMAMLLQRLELGDRPMQIEVFPHVPRAMGLGGSAALAVAIIRALDRHFRLGLDDPAVNALAFECERTAHGTPSGVDNTVATYGLPVLYRREQDRPEFRRLQIAVPLPLVIGISGDESLTASYVARVHNARERQPALYERLFDEIDALTQAAAGAIGTGDLRALGDYMNLCHGFLNALQVSTPALEHLVDLCRRQGALGAKLTGGGGGGSIVALCPDDPGRVIDAIQASGYQAFGLEVE
jgi:hydroxymethylglutaryl-CoA reductase